MIGTVSAINPNRAMIAVFTEEGYSIIEMLSDDPPNLGDQLCWNGSVPLGSEIVDNITNGKSYRVFFQNHHVAKSQVRGQLRLT